MRTLPKAIFLSCGHGKGAAGANDDGARGNGTTERAEAMDVTRELAARLQRDPVFKNVPLFLIGLDERLSVVGKTKKINDVCRARGYTVDDTLLLEVHLNSGGNALAHGLEVWYYAGDDTAKAFALTLAQSLKEATRMPYHGTPVKGDTSNRHGRLGIIRDTIPIAALLELGYLSNPTDAAMHLDPVQDDLFSLGALNGIRQWYGYPALEETTAAHSPDSSPVVPTTPTTETGPDGESAAAFTPNEEMRVAFDWLFQSGIFTEQSPRDEWNYRYAALRLRELRTPITSLPPQP